MWKRVRHWFGRSRFDAELEDEIRFHIETRAEELERAGVPRQDAIRQARREFGNQTRAREETQSAWRFRWLEAFSAGPPPGLRALPRRPGITRAGGVLAATRAGARRRGCY